MNYETLVKIIDENFIGLETKSTVIRPDKRNIDLIESLITQGKDYNELTNINSRRFITDCIKQSVLDYFENSKEQKFEYIHFVFSMLNDQFKDVKFKEIDDIEWNKIVPLIKENYSHTYDINEVSEDVLFLLHKTIRNKNLKPYKLVTEYGWVKKDKEKFKKIAKKIDSLVHELGGQNILNSLLNFLNEKKYSSEYKRYLLSAGTYQYGSDLVPFIPINYLLNLSLKHLHNKGNITPERFDYLLSLSRQFVLLYDLQEFHTVNKFFGSIKINKDSLYKRLLFDNIFRFRQVTWNVFPDLIENLLKTTVEKDGLFLSKYGFRITDYVKLIKKVYQEPRIENITSTDLLSQGFSSEEIKILDFCSSNKIANNCYLLPTDFDKITFLSKPLIKKNNNCYFIINKALSGWGFYNVISDINENSTYVDIGNNIESYVLEKLKTLKSINLYCGDYDNSLNEHGECDAVIEDDQYIIFIEIKKKSFTKESLLGNNLSEMLFDLSAMLITSQAQASQHEFSLLKDNYICFNNRKKLEYKNQKIYKISLTLFDLYMFNDHSFVMGLIDYLRTKEFHFEKESSMTREEIKEALSQRNIKGVNKKREKLNDYINRLEQMGISRSESAFYSYFFSLEQLMFLITKAKDNNKPLGYYLDEMKNISLSTGCFYTEFDEINRIKNSK